jgi:hypothetical protein
LLQKSVLKHLFLFVFVLWLPVHFKPYRVPWFIFPFLLNLQFR